MRLRSLARVCVWGRERERRREDRLMDRYVSFVTKRVSGTSRTVIERKWTELAYELAYFLPMVQYSSRVCIRSSYSM